MPHDTPATAHDVAVDAGQRELYIAMLREFANHGFRKTSMVALAEAAGISRPTLYKRFASKDAVLEWAVDGLVRDLRADALQRLNDGGASIGEVLLDVFCRWLCPIVALLRGGRHGEEFLGLSANRGHHVNTDPLAGFTASIADFLLARKVRQSKRAADELAFLLAMAAKGLMLTSPSENEFRSGMARAIRGALTERGT